MNKQDIIAKLVERLEPLEYVHALWLEGADANGTADAYSDIDLWVDVADAHIDEAIAMAEQALQEIAPFDYKAELPHGHPQIRQLMYHLAGTSEYLIVDFCFQLHSRPEAQYSYYEDDPLFAAKVIFDKSGVINISPGSPPVDTKANAALLKKMRLRYNKHIWVLKNVRRGHYLEAWENYREYVIEPLVCLLRMIHTPAFADVGCLHISLHVPPEDLRRLEELTRVTTFAEMEANLPKARAWYAILEERLGGNLA